MSVGEDVADVESSFGGEKSHDQMKRPTIIKTVPPKTHHVLRTSPSTRIPRLAIHWTPTQNRRGFGVGTSTRFRWRQVRTAETHNHPETTIPAIKIATATRTSLDERIGV